MTTREKVESLGFKIVNKREIAFLLGTTITSYRRNFPLSCGLSGIVLGGETPFNEHYTFIIVTDKEKPGDIIAALKNQYYDEIFDD